MKIITWSIINNEMDYLPDVIEEHLPWVDGIYILDTGSIDGSLEFLKAQEVSHSDKILVEQYHTSFTPQWEVEWKEMKNPFPEVEVRNYASYQAEQWAEKKWPGEQVWLLQLDGDEVFLPETRKIIEASFNNLCIGHHTINPVCKLEEHPLERRGGLSLFDPHIRIWKAKQQINYIKNPAYGTQQFHCIPTKAISKSHLFHHPLTKFVDTPIHFHLHWMYGKKVDAYYRKQGILNRHDIIKTQFVNKFGTLLSSRFWDHRQAWIDQ